MRMIKKHRFPLIALGIFTTYLISLPSAHSGPVYQSPGPNQTYGNVSHSQRIAAGSGNPASPAADQSRGGEFAKTSGMLAIGAGVEYGAINNIFDLFNKTSESIEPSPPGEGGDDQPDEPSDGINMDEILDDIIGNNPEIEEAVNQIAKQAITLGSALALIATEGYGKAFVTADAPFTLKTRVYGGTFSFDINVSATSKIAGLTDTLDFDKDLLRSQLQAAAQLADDAGATDFELNGDMTLTVDPSNNKVRLNFQNDSLLITKAATIQEYAVGYSHPVGEFENGQLFLGVKPKYIRAGLTRVGVRFGDITDSEELFEEIKNAEFAYDDEFSMDLGAMWVSDYYQVGGSLTNINEPSFAFPKLDLSNFNNQEIIHLAEKGRVYEMERQIKLEAGFHTVDRKWTINTALDVNSVADPMGDDYQWASISTGYATKSWWVPGARVGLHSNLAGTELTYLSAGVTLFKYVDIDVSSTLDTVEIDDKNLPRGLNFSIGVAASF